MIVVEHARPRDGQRPNDYIEAALGLPDEYGNPFEVITLRWKRRNHPHSKTQGFEDTFIGRATGGGLAITYRQPGGVTWYQILGGVFEGKLAKTPHNMKTLAYNFKDGLWDIKDLVIRAEVEAMSEKIEDELSPEMKKFNADRRRDGKRTPFEKAEQAGMPVDELMRNEEKHALADRMELSRKGTNLAAKEAKLNEEQRKLNEDRQKLAQAVGASGVSTVGYTAEALGEMHLSKIKQILRNEYNQETPQMMKKVDAVAEVLRLQGGGAPQSVAAPEAEAVTS